MQTTKQFRDLLSKATETLSEKEAGSGSVNHFDRISEALTFANELVTQLTRMRDDALAEVYAYTGSYQGAADATGLSRARVQQIIERQRTS